MERTYNKDTKIQEVAQFIKVYQRAVELRTSYYPTNDFISKGHCVISSQYNSYQLNNDPISMLENRKLQVKISKHLSSSLTPEHDLPQGSPFYSTLYNFYCADMYHKNLEEFDITSYILQYADDTTIFSHSNNMQNTIGHLQDYPKPKHDSTGGD
ncbi:hypothetical protein HHI36_017959 [Cryptolaemus montrouzieri]|uniref:Reverse transcriptase domain-containing protein n=1 Tax=Cryptolaemus montrouzieri TaxID=559131 RepID=A0ABD2NYX5_9CUCU